MSDRANSIYLPSACTSKPDQALAIITIGTESGLVRLEKHCTCHPHAGATAKAEGKAPEKASAQGGSEVEKHDVKKTKRERERNKERAEN